MEADPLDFDALHDDAMAHNRVGECPMCESIIDRVLCWCGVCLKYCHDRYSHEPMDPEPDLP